MRQRLQSGLGFRTRPFELRRGAGILGLGMKNLADRAVPTFTASACPRSWQRTAVETSHFVVVVLTSELGVLGADSPSRNSASSLSSKPINPSPQWPVSVIEAGSLNLFLPPELSKHALF